MWYYNLAGARQGRGGFENATKPEGLEKDPREGCLYLRKRKRATRQKAKQTLERERQVEAGTELPFTLLLWSATVARRPKYRPDKGEVKAYS
jgi:hypothetical protein